MTEETVLEDDRKDLDEAIQKFFAEQYGPANGPLVVTDWVIYAETVKDDDSRNIFIGVSPSLTLWKLRGMSWFGAKIVEQFAG